MTDFETDSPFPPAKSGGATGVKLLLLFLLAAYFGFVVYLWNNDRGLEIGKSEFAGQKAPDFTVTTLDGVTLQLSALKGKRVVVDLWATWCGPCRMEIPHFERISKESADVVVIGVSNEDEQTLRPFVESMGITYHIASANLPAPYGTVSAIPTTFFIDREGNIDNVAVGYHDYPQLRRYALGE